MHIMLDSAIISSSSTFLSNVMFTLACYFSLPSMLVCRFCWAHRKDILSYMRYNNALGNQFVFNLFFLGCDLLSQPRFKRKGVSMGMVTEKEGYPTGGGDRGLVVC